jgi:hypothetical protein
VTPQLEQLTVPFGQMERQHRMSERSSRSSSALLSQNRQRYSAEANPDVEAVAVQNKCTGDGTGSCSPGASLDLASACLEKQLECSRSRGRELSTAGEFSEPNHVKTVKRWTIIISVGRGMVHKARLIGNCELPHIGNKNFALMLSTPNLISHTRTL